MNQFYNIKALSNAETEIAIDEPIGFFGVNAKDFINDLQKITSSRITLRVFSPGGSVIAGFAIYEALLRHPARITAHVDFAASMASVVIMAADTIVINDSGMIMIHKPWIDMAGNADELRDMADTLDKMEASAIRAYQRHSALSAEKIAALMTANTWMDANEAVQNGFASRVIEAPPIAAKLRGVDMSIFNNAPSGIALGKHKKESVMTLEEALAALKAANTKVDTLEGSMADLQKKHDAAVAVAAELDEAKTKIVELEANALAADKKAKEAAAEAKATIEGHEATIKANGEKIEDLEAKVVSLAPGLKTNAKEREQSGGSTGDPTAFWDHVKSFEDDGMDKEQAILKARADYPDDYQAMLDAAGSV